LSTIALQMDVSSVEKFKSVQEVAENLNSARHEITLSFSLQCQAEDSASCVEFNLETVATCPSERAVKSSRNFLFRGGNKLCSPFFTGLLVLETAGQHGIQAT